MYRGTDRNMKRKGQEQRSYLNMGNRTGFFNGQDGGGRFSFFVQ